MTTETADSQKMGSNSETELKRRIDRRVGKLDEIAELQEELKTMKAEDKSDGFTEQAIMDAVRLRRADADKILATLTLEAEKAVYRRVAGLPTSLEAAQELAQEEAETVPEVPSKRRRRADLDDADAGA